MITLNDYKVKPTKFPDNTSQIWGIEGLTGMTARVVWTFESESEFMHLAQLKTLLDTRGIKAILHIPYLPYARQDKPVSNDTTFALTTFAYLLNALNFEQVFCIDPHSEIPRELIKHYTAIMPIGTIDLAVRHTNPDVVCYPDKGALQKYAQFVQHKYVYADKVRDQQTGKILSIELKGDVKDKSVLIVDDICDGGGTFCGLSAELKKSGVKEVNLYVTHGIFSKGLKPLKEAGIHRIFTKDGEVSEYHGNICYQEIR